MRDPGTPQTSQVPAPRGRPFANGNPGRKPGSKNRTTLVAAALLEGEAEELVGKAIELAKAGDVAMLKFLLERILPRERLIKLDLPRMEFADDAVEALGKVMSDVAEGRMTPSEGAAVAPLINSCARAIDMADLVKRMDSLAHVKSEQKTVVRYETVEERRLAMIAKGWTSAGLDAMEAAMEPKFIQEQRKKEELRAALRERGIDPDILEAPPDVLAAIGLKFLEYKKPDPVQ
jgi:hypothetical protein